MMIDDYKYIYICTHNIQTSAYEQNYGLIHLSLSKKIKIHALYEATTMYKITHN